MRSWGRTPPARHALVSEVVKEIDPDVLLLQETKSRPLVKEIIEKLGKRKYVEIAPLEEEGARENSWQEAKVLFDENKFETIEDGEELGFALQTLDGTKTTYHIPLREKEEGKPREAGVGNVVKERVSWVCLRRKNGPNAGKTITFMSFHNYNTIKSHEGASVFCGLVRAMKYEIGFDVVAGVDFNCEEEKLDPTQPEKPHPTQPEKPHPTQPEKLDPTQPEKPHPTQPEKPHPTQPEKPHPTQPEKLDPTQPEELDPTQPEEFNTKQKWNGINIPQYDMSQRRTRKNKKKIDYIVTTLGQYEVSVKPIDFTAPGGTASKLEGKLIEDSRRETHSYRSDDYDIVVDHDPLLCTLTWPTPPKMSS